MKGYYTYPPSHSSEGGAQRTAPRIAVVTQGVKLPGEQPGYTRFRVIAETLADAGYQIELITSTFQHWEKKQRKQGDTDFNQLSYRVTLIPEPGYRRNLDPARIRSHAVFARNLTAYFNRRFAANPDAYNLIYSEIPPNDMARACAEAAYSHGIPYIADVNDLWPEAMRMALSVPLLSSIALKPFERDARYTYRLLSAAVGTSDEYAERPSADRDEPYLHRTVYVGNNLEAFDSGAQENAADIKKPAEQIWIAYAGTLGASYDLATLIDASVICAEHGIPLRVKIMGDGPEKDALEKRARRSGAPVDFLGYMPHALMAAYLCASDITVNSLVRKAPQSIVTKIGDYLAAGIPLINTGSSPEFRNKVGADGFGINVPAEDPRALAEAIRTLVADPARCREMGLRAREVACTQFDQRTAYKAITDLVSETLDESQYERRIR